jgi:FkbM family methyltransferase
MTAFNSEKPEVAYPLRGLAGWLMRAVVWYSRCSPIRFGRFRLQQAAVRALAPIELLAHTQEGARFILRFPADSGWESVYFIGEFESGTTRLVSKILRADDVTFDIGANLGWYTVLMAGCTPAARCHAFEPCEPLVQRLMEHCDLNRITDRVQVNPTAVGNHAGHVELHTFRGLGHGHSSISSLGRMDFSSSVARMTTLDDYCQEQRLERLDFVKVDVEGAEMAVLEGARQILRRPEPPMWLLEMNCSTSRSFGYSPAHLLRHLESHGAYRFLRVVAGWGEILPMRSTDDFAHADNVFCVPECHWHRLENLFPAGESETQP